MIRVTRAGWLIAAFIFLSVSTFLLGFRSPDSRTLHTYTDAIHFPQAETKQVIAFDDEKSLSSEFTPAIQESSINHNPLVPAKPVSSPAAAVQGSITNPDPLEALAEPVSSPSALPVVEAPDYNTFQHPGAIPHQSMKELGLEQIQADFPGTYKNPNDWFEQPSTPVLADELALLSKDEKLVVEGLRNVAGGNTPERLAKIKSLWNVNESTRSWQDHISTLDEEGLAPLTKWAQAFIHNHQHPVSCEEKKFYVLKNNWPKHGLGAIIRRVMVEMTYAINDGRILVLDREDAPGNTLVEADCGTKGYPSLQCVVEDITSCEAYVTEKNSVTSLSTTTREYPPVVMASLYASMEATGLKATGAFARYWWRSQMYGYIMRPRPTAMKRMLEMRQNGTLQVGAMLDREKTATAITVPFPLPPSTVSIHIRHGNKANEGLLVSTRDYIVAAERLIVRNPLAYRKRAFISTEDPQVITEIMKTPFINPSLSFGNTDWLWYYSDIPRVNWGPKQNLEAVGNKTDALLMHMMQLFMALECDTFIGNRNSNWNKMIDALRCTLMDKCKLPYIDAGFVADWEHFP